MVEANEPEFVEDEEDEEEEEEEKHTQEGSSLGLTNIDKDAVEGGGGKPPNIHIQTSDEEPTRSRIDCDATGEEEGSESPRYQTKTALHKLRQLNPTGKEQLMYLHYLEEKGKRAPQQDFLGFVEEIRRKSPSPKSSYFSPFIKRRDLSQPVSLPKSRSNHSLFPTTFFESKKSGTYFSWPY